MPETRRPGYPSAASTFAAIRRFYEAARSLAAMGVDVQAGIGAKDMGWPTAAESGDFRDWLARDRLFTIQFEWPASFSFEMAFEIPAGAIDHDGRPDDRPQNRG